MIFPGIKMEQSKTCPVCGKTLYIISDEGEYIDLRTCEHFLWRSNLGTIANDEILLQGGLKIRLLKR